MEGLSIGWMIARIIVHGSAGVEMFFGIYQILKMSHKYQWVSRSVSYLLEQTSQADQKRQMAYQKQYEEVGLVEKVPIIRRWDQMFAQSMIQQKYPWLNGQLYGSLLLISGSVLGIGGLLILHRQPGLGICVGILLFGMVLFGGMFYVNLIRKRKWMQTEKELIPFLNIVDNFSKTEQDLFQIFEMAVPYLREPVKTALEECSRHASATGNRMEAVRDLIYRIEHPKFREIVQNLEICSRNEANYARILSDMRDGLSAYMSNRKEEAAILREGQIQICVIVCLGIPMVAMLSVITQVPLADMTGNLFGKMIIVYWIVLVLVIVYQMFFSTTGKES